jgi:serine protease AprX
MTRLLPALIILFALWGVEGKSQTKYWVQFTDKNSSPYTVSNPSAFLSQRAINRRTAQNIPVSIQDIPVNPSYIQQVLGTGNVTLLNRSKWFNAITIQTTDQNALNAIQALPFVSGLQPVNRIVRSNPFESWDPYSPLEKLQVNPPSQSFNYGSSFDQVNQIGVVCMHNAGYTGAGLMIGVMDAGFMNVDTLTSFDSLFLQNRILGTWDFVDNHASVYEDHWHGTMVLACMAANWPGTLIGTAPHASYWLFRTEDVGSEYIIEEDNWVSAAEFADSVGCDILNTSLGYTTFDNPAQNHTYQDMDGNTTRITIATDIAVSKGIFAVCSAGNSGNSSWNFIGAPADADSVLAVGAVDNTGAYVSFSSNGPSYDGRVKPNVAARGSQVLSQSPIGGTANANGTSFSSPLVAGGVACLWQANPSLPVMQLFNAIQMSASQFATPDTNLGYGIPNFCSANVIASQGNSFTFSNDEIYQVYPNPFTGSFWFQFYSANDQEIKIRLSDISGRILMEENEFVFANSLSPFEVKGSENLNPGVYVLQVTGLNKRMAVRVVKTRQ